LKYEAAVYRELNRQGKEARVYDAIVGIPELYYSGQEGDFNVMVMELLGQNMDSLFNFCNRKFGLRTVLMFADQAVLHGEYHAMLVKTT
jgi:hypothetical protein